MKTAVVFQSCQNFVKNDFMNFIFPKMFPFYVTPGQNTILTQPKELFSYINPFDSCLIMKMTQPYCPIRCPAGEAERLSRDQQDQSQRQEVLKYLLSLVVGIEYRRRIKTEELAKFVAVVWGDALKKPLVCAQDFDDS